MGLKMSSKHRLQRNRRRRRLGGVCAGIADYLGVSVTLVRLLVVISVFFSFSLTLWIYLALWLLLPAESETPMPRVSWSLGRQLKRMEKRVRQAHRQLDPPLADLIQSTFDAVKTIAPDFEGMNSGSSSIRSMREQAFQRFPGVVGQLLALPAAFLGEAPDERAGETPFGRLVTELRQLHSDLENAAIEAVNRRLREELGGIRAYSAEVETWKSQLAPLQSRLSERADAETITTLARIEEKLVFLLSRSGGDQALFDLNPFQVRKIAFEYLPDAVDQYLRLPPGMARSQPLVDGKTAEESLKEQLLLLDHGLQDLAKSLFESDAQGLLIHGRFLKEKFAEQPFRLSD